MGLEEMERSEATRGQKDPNSDDATVSVHRIAPGM